MRRAVTGMALAAMLCGAPAARGAGAPPGSTPADAAAVGGGASAPVDSTPHAALGWTDLLREEETLRFETGQSRLQLAHAFLQFGSEVVATPESLLVRNRDYGIDYSHGLLFLLRPAASTFECRVTYLHLPGPRQQQFHAAEVLSREEALASAAAGRRPHRAGPPTCRCPRQRRPVGSARLPRCSSAVPTPSACLSAPTGRRRSSRRCASRWRASWAKTCR
jgi:hypothetical protein